MDPMMAKLMQALQGLQLGVGPNPNQQGMQPMAMTGQMPVPGGPPGLTMGGHVAPPGRMPGALNARQPADWSAMLRFNRSF